MQIRTAVGRATSATANDTSLYLLGGKNQLVLARQTNQEIAVESNFSTSETIWHLPGLVEEGRVAAVTGSNKPTEVGIFDISGSTMNKLETVMSVNQTNRIVTGSLVRQDFFVATKTSVSLVDKIGKIRTTLGFENGVTAASYRDNITAVGTGENLAIVDMREKKICTEIANAHAMEIRALDISGHTIASGCEEGVMQIWDARDLQKSLHRVQDAHLHWVTNLALNPAQANLLLSSGSDCAVNVWNVSGDKPALIQTHKMEDSVYAVAWSQSSSRHYLSASFDGKISGSKISKLKS
jgi:WD40 repeat protein